MRLPSLCTALSLILIAAAPASGQRTPEAARQVMLDDFENFGGWKGVHTHGEGAVITVKSDKGRTGDGMLMEFEFMGFMGGVMAYKEFPMTLPPNYRFSFDIKADAPVNNFEFRLVDSLGDVWWNNKLDYEFPREWTTIHIKKRQIPFAWGPLWGGEPHRIAKIELNISVSGGGKGKVWIDNLRLEPLDDLSARPLLATARATSSFKRSGPVITQDGKGLEGWRSAGKGRRESIRLKASGLIDLGGLVINWDSLDYATAFDLLLSADGKSWTKAYSALDSKGGLQYVPTGEKEAAFLRLDMKKSSRGKGYAFRALEIRGPEFSQSANALYESIAHDAPVGLYPRYLLNKQSYWTIMGASGDLKEAMMNEQGQIETDRMAYSFEPFLYTDGKLITWHDVRTRPSLEQSYLPIPSVEWIYDNALKLNVTAVAAGPSGSSTLYAKYTVMNKGVRPREGKLFVAMRPFQVNPPWQIFTVVGGTARIGSIEGAEPGGALKVNGKPVIPLTPPTRAGAAMFDQGDITRYLQKGVVPKPIPVRDSSMHASGALQFDWSLAPGDSQSFVLMMPFHPGMESDAGGPGAEEDSGQGEQARTDVRQKEFPPGSFDRDRDSVTGGTRVGGSLGDAARESEILGADDAAVSTGEPGGKNGKSGGMPGPAGQSDAYDRAHRETVEFWKERLDNFHIKLPPQAQPVENTIRSNLAYILINKDGPALQPGSRAYERSWMRDGCMIAASLLQMGVNREIREYIDWYAGYQRVDGFVPCIVDRRGAEAVPEHDSHGQFIYLIGQYFRFTRDTTWLKGKWDNVQRAARYIQSLRAQRKTDEYRNGTPEQRACYGLVPQSISHEGYSAKPMHSYWDNFFCLRGLKDASFMARVLGDVRAAEEFAAEADDYRKDIGNSLRQAMKNKNIDYVPGCVELGDKGGLSNTIIINPVDELDVAPLQGILNDLDTFWGEFRGREDSTAQWWAYLPYEWRYVGAFVHLGQKERALTLFKTLMRDRRPPEWNMWAESIWKDAEAGKSIGDMPHAWVGSDFIRAVRSMFVYEQEKDTTLVVGAGIPEEWVNDPAGVSVRDLPTYYGLLSYAMKREGRQVVVELSGDLALPAGKVIVKSPMNGPIRSVTGDGRKGPGGNDVIITRLPAGVVVE